MHKAILSAVVIAVSLALAPAAHAASVIGFLGNFDVINDTGTVAHGFEVELEGLHISDITSTFGGAGRGFPSGRGFNRATAVERYGAPTLVEYTSGATFGTRVTYAGLFDSGTNAWDPLNSYTPTVAVGKFVTPGESCWTGRAGYSAATPCDHFGVSAIKNASKTTYSWLLETSPSSNVLSNGLVVLPAPVWQVVPAPPPVVVVGVPPPPPAPPRIVAQVQAPAPVPPPLEVEPQWGDAIWVKVFTTELPDPVQLEDLIGGNPKVDLAKTEKEWQLLQKDPGNPLSGQLESGYGAPVGPNAASILRRYEFYKFGGTYDAVDHHAVLEGNDSNPLGADVGTYLGAQNGAVNLAAVAAVPEPETYALMLAGLGLVVGIARRRSRC